MQAPPNTMPGKASEGFDVMSFGGALSRTANPVDGRTGTGLAQRIGSSQWRGMAQARLELGCGRNKDRSAGTGEIASKLGRDIHVNNIPRLHNPRPRNAVSRLLVDADAGSARKVIHHPGGRLGALFF